MTSYLGDLSMIGGMSTATALEAGYRRSLRWYPRDWRDEHEDEVVGVLLDVAEASGAVRPSRAERLSLALHGLGHRILGRYPLRLRSLAATSAFLGGTAFALFHFVLFEWEPWATIAPYEADVFHPFTNDQAYVELIWLLGATVFFLGARRAGMGVIGLAGAAAVALLFSRYQLPTAWVDPTSLAAMIVATGFLLIGPVQRRGWIVSPLTVIGLGAGMSLAAYVKLTSWAEFAFPATHVSWNREVWDVPTRSRFVDFGVPVAVVAMTLLALSLARRRRATLLLVAVVMPWLAFWAIHIIHDGIIGPYTEPPTTARWVIAGLFGAALIAALALWHPSRTSSRSENPQSGDPVHG